MMNIITIIWKGEYESIGMWNDKTGEESFSNIELCINPWSIKDKSKDVQSFVDFGFGSKNFRVQ